MATDRAATRWRGAIVGLGGVARQSHLPAFRDAALAQRLEIVCAVDPVHAAAGRVDGLPVVPDIESLAAWDGAPIQFVDVATPSATHVGLTRRAIEQGLHVLCEKPVATRRADALDLAARARAHGVVLFPCHQYRYNPVWRRIREWIAAGVLGRWHLAEIAVHRTAADRGSAPSAATAWRTQRDASGGGVLVDHGAHLLYTLLDLGGMPTRVQAWTGRLAHRDYEVEDTAQVRLGWDDDRAATLFLTWAARHRETRVHIVGERGAITWIDGTLTLERDGHVDAYDFARELDKVAYASWFVELFGAFADALDHGADSPAAHRALDDVVQVATVLDAAYASADAAAEVHVATR